MTSPSPLLREMTSLARSRVLPGQEANVGAPLEPRLQSVIDLVNAGEPLVAFEILLDNLLEYDIPLDRLEKNKLHELGVAVGADPQRLGWIRELRPPPAADTS